MWTVSRGGGSKYSIYGLVVVLAAAGLGIYWNLRLAIADWLERRATVTASVHAIALAPGNEDYLRRAAQLADETGGDGTEYYTKAAAADPYAANDWVQLGLHAEREGRYQEAERDLLHAARISQLFEPRWTLANFYFRRGQTSNTLCWIQKALSMGGGDLTAVFRLCWEATRDPGRISHEAMPSRPGVLAQYLGFLFSTNRFEESTAIAIRLAEIANRDQVDALLNYCDQALAAGCPDEARKVWNMLSRRGLISQPIIGRNRGDVVRNSNFHAPLTGRTFDWKASAAEGVLIDSGGGQRDCA